MVCSLVRTLTPTSPDVWHGPCIRRFMLASFRPLHVLAMPSPVPCLPRRCCHARSDMTRLQQQGTGHETLQMRAEAASGAAPSLAAMNSRSQHDLTQRHANIRARSRNRTHAFATDSTDSSASAERPVSDLLRALSSATRPLPLAITTHPTDERSMPTIGVTSYYVPPSTLLVRIAIRIYHERITLSKYK